jgi:hypothetical protein
MADIDWMSAYQKRKLGEMHLPGSHDAGTDRDNVELTMCGTPSNSVTQDKPIKDQLVMGTRFFDVRLTTHNNQVVPHHTTAGQGAYGTKSINTIIGEAATFCKNNRSEVVILRISHTSIKTKVDEIIKASAAGQLSIANGNLCELTLEQIKLGGGGLVCILNTGGKSKSQDFKKAINQSQGIHSFSKYKTTGDKRGIATCGCYSGTNALHNVMRNALRGQFAHTKDHSPERNDHLWQVYWQKTYLNPLHGTGISEGSKKKSWMKHDGMQTNGRVSGGTHQATSHIIKLMEGHKGYMGENYNVAAKKKHFWNKQKVVMRSTLTSTRTVRFKTLPNIFSYDFVKEDINDQIIALNNNLMQEI